MRLLKRGVLAHLVRVRVRVGVRVRVRVGLGLGCTRAPGKGSVRYAGKQGNMARVEVGNRMSTPDAQG